MLLPFTFSPFLLTSSARVATNNRAFLFQRLIVIWLLNAKTHGEDQLD